MTLVSFFTFLLLSTVDLVGLLEQFQDQQTLVLVEMNECKRVNFDQNPGGRWECVGARGLGPARNHGMHPW